MSNQQSNSYIADFVTAPGFYIQEKLGEIGMTQTDLAARIGRTKKTVSEIVTGKAPIEPETALQLERVLGIPARFWNSAERQYRDHLVRQAERNRLKGEAERLKRFPVKAMCKVGWLPKQKDPVAELSDLLSFFGVASFEALDHIDNDLCASFRQSAVHPVDKYAVLAWLRAGEREAQAVVCEPFDRSRFHKALDEIRSLTTSPIVEATRKAAGLCASSGVALVFIPEIPGTRAWGATRWLTPDKALIQLSLRGKTDDQLWFTFFHEAGHICLHPKRDIFIEIGDTPDALEEAANRFAADLLIPPAAWQLLLKTRPRSGREIKLFAKQQGIAPGIVVGRMQREGMLPWKNLNHFKRSDSRT
jgi:addiction module HigA family antidote